MRLRFFRTESFWLPILFGLVLSLSVAALGYAALSFSEKAIYRDIRERSQAGMDRYEAYYKDGGIPRVRDYINTRLFNAGNLTQLALQRDGKKLAGNLPTLQPILGEHEVQSKYGPVLGYGAMLAPNIYVFHGMPLIGAIEARDEINRTLVLIFTVSLVISLLGGFLLSRRFLSRVDAISNTCREIMAGNLKKRIPVQTRYNELDGLGKNINVMLDRIATLMENLRQVSSDVAHDLRTPLSHLRHGVERALEGAKTKEEYESALRNALTATDDILASFTAVLNLSEVEGGARGARFTALNISELLQRTLEIYRPVAEDCKHGIAIDAASDCIINGDGDLMLQLLSNLVENAIIHTPEGTTITVGCHKKSGTIEIFVRDNGPGISPEDRQKVFQRFFREDSSRNKPGHGLGLSMVAAIAEVHLGTAVAQENPASGGVGVEFSVSIPRYNPGTVPP